MQILDSNFEDPFGVPSEMRPERFVLLSEARRFVAQKRIGRLSFEQLVQTLPCDPFVTGQAQQSHIDVGESRGLWKFAGCCSQPLLGSFETASARVEGREFIERGGAEGSELLAHFEGSARLFELLGGQIRNSQ